MKNNKQSGFTLIELAISTMIVGILLAGILVSYGIWVEKKNLDRTADNVEQVAWAVSAYRSANGRYPCPAPLDAARTSAGYGLQTDCSSAAVAPGSCSGAGNKYCVANSMRGTIALDHDYDSSTPTINVTPKVRIGTIPFRELNLPEEYAYDAYGDRIIYAVTENLAYINDANHPKAGGVEIIYKDNYATDTTKSRLETSGTANFVVFSPGPDRIGGYNMDGRLAPTPCVETTSDGRNCDFNDGSGFDATFFISEAVEATGNDKHDDVGVFQLPLNMPLWARSSDDPEDIYSIKSDLNPQGKVGSDYLYNFYVDPARPSYVTSAYDNTRLWVGGNIKVQSNGANSGQVQSFENCDRKGENCFKPEIIGGAGIKCSNNDQPMKGVRAGDADCAEDTDLVLECPGEQVVQTITNGELVCADLPCKATQVTSCGENFILPVSESGLSYNFSAGDVYKCSKGAFTCTSGIWVGPGFDNLGAYDPYVGFIDGNGANICTCTPGPVAYSYGCGPGGVGLDAGTLTSNCGLCQFSYNGTSSCTYPPGGGGCTPGVDCPPTNCTPGVDCPPASCTPGVDCPGDPGVPPDNGGGVGNPPCTGGSGAGCP